MSKNNDSWIFPKVLYFLSQKFFFEIFLGGENSTFKKIIQLVLKLSRCYGDCDELSFLYFWSSYFWLNLRHLCLYNLFCWWGCLARFVACSNIKMGIVALLGPHPFCVFSLPHSPHQLFFFVYNCIIILFLI